MVKRRTYLVWLVGFSFLAILGILGYGLDRRIRAKGETRNATFLCIDYVIGRHVNRNGYAAERLDMMLPPVLMKEAERIFPEGLCYEPREDVYYSLEEPREKALSLFSWDRLVSSGVIPVHLEKSGRVIER